MSVLAIDTATRGRTVVILTRDGGELLDGRAADGAAVAGLASALRSLNLRELTAVVCVTGPGTYTGLRAGIAAALGVAQARATPLHGVCSLDVVAASAPEGRQRIIAGLEAGRGSEYTAEYERSGDSWRRRGNPRRGLESALGASQVVRLSSADASAHQSALAAVVASALQTPPLDLAGLAATYTDETTRTAAEPPVSSE